MTMEDHALDRHAPRMGDGAAVRRRARVLDRGFLRRIEAWENAPHNRPGADKSWVERFFRQARRHFARAERISR